MIVSECTSFSGSPDELREEEVSLDSLYYSDEVVSCSDFFADSDSDYDSLISESDAESNAPSTCRVNISENCRAPDNVLQDQAIFSLQGLAVTAASTPFLFSHLSPPHFEDGRE